MQDYYQQDLNHFLKGENMGKAIDTKKEVRKRHLKTLKEKRKDKEGKN